jgi:hypothetical protein
VQRAGGVATDGLVEEAIDSGGVGDQIDSYTGIFGFRRDSEKWAANWRENSDSAPAWLEIAEKAVLE